MGGFTTEGPYSPNSPIMRERLQDLLKWATELSMAQRRLKTAEQEFDAAVRAVEQAGFDSFMEFLNGPRR